MHLGIDRHRCGAYVSVTANTFFSLQFLSKPFYSSQSLALQGEDYSHEITVVAEIQKNGTDESEEQVNNAKQQLQNSKEISEAKKVLDFPLLYTVHTEWYDAQHLEGILQSSS